MKGGRKGGEGGDVGRRHVTHLVTRHLTNHVTHLRFVSRHAKLMHKLQQGAETWMECGLGRYGT